MTNSIIDPTVKLFSEILKKLKEDHLIQFPFVFMTFYGNGLMFLWLTNYLAFPKLPISVIEAIIVPLSISMTIYFMFLLLSALSYHIDPQIHEAIDSKKIFNVAFVINYLFFAILFIAWLNPLGAISQITNSFSIIFQHPLFASNSVITRFITTTILFFISIIVWIAWAKLSKKTNNHKKKA